MDLPASWSELKLLNSSRTFRTASGVWIKYSACANEWASLFFHSQLVIMDSSVTGIQEPFDLIRLSLSERVFVKLRGDRELTGILHVRDPANYSKNAHWFAFVQAYDGHMNLIMSDVEETIMIVDPDGVTNGQGVVNVSQSYFDIGHISYTSRLRNEKWRCYLWEETVLSLFV